ncbi:MAG: AAA family ATPase [Deltaproteobacteria bacterium]|nr:AAA family ATPase [Deltaproteobacteria bacterium]
MIVKSDHYMSTADRLTDPGSNQDSSKRPFVGRQAELNLLTTTFRTPLSRDCRLFLIEGEPGIGKTRLCEEAARVAASHLIPVVWGRSWKGLGAPPLFQWHQVFSSLHSLERDLKDLHSRRLRALLRVTSGELPQALRDPSRTAPTERFHFFESVATFLARVTRVARLAVVLDDIHWADSASLMLLRYLLEQGVPERLTIIATSRVAEKPEPQELVTFRYQAACSQSAHVLRLRSLDRDSLREYVAISLGVPPTESEIATLLMQTAGNAFLLKELVDQAIRAGGLKDLADTPPPSAIAASLEARYQPLSPETRSLLDVAAVFGYPFTARFLARVTARELAAVDYAIAEAISAGIIIQSDTPDTEFRFAHTILRDASYARLSLAERRSIHRTLATDLKSQLDSQDPHILLLFAHHLLSGGTTTEDQRTHLSILISAAERALQMFAYEDAVRMYRQALDFLPRTPVNQRERCQLLLSLGEAERLSGRGGEAREAFRAAATIARLCSDIEPFAQAALGLSGFRASNPVDVEAISLIEEALERADQLTLELRHELLCARIVALHFAPHLTDMNRDCDDALFLADQLRNNRSLALASYARLLTVFATVPAEEINNLAEQTAALAETSGETRIYFAALTFRYGALIRLGRLPECDRILHQLILATQRAPFARHRWQLALFEAGRRLAWDTRENIRLYIERAFAIGADLEPLTASQHEIAQKVVLEYLTGNLSNNSALLFEAVQTHPDSAIARAAWALSLSDPDNPADAQDALSWFCPARIDSIPGAFASLTLAFLAEASFLAGDRTLAVLVHTRLEAWSDELITLGFGAGIVGAAGFYLGLLAWLQNDRAHALELLEAAAELELRVGARHSWRRTRAALSALRNGQRTFSIPREDTNDFGRAPNLGLSGGAPPSAPHRLPNVFRKEVGVWTICFNGQTSYVRDQLGLEYIRLLLRAPEKDIHAIELVQSVSRSPAETHRFPIHQTGIEQTDREALNQYRQRLAELSADIESADIDNDTGRAERLRAEQELLLEEISRSRNYKNHIRRAGSDAERARVAVRNRITSALKSIGSADAKASRHLQNAIRTGLFCSYRPEDSCRWELD